MTGFFASSVVQKERPDSAFTPKCGVCGLYKTCQNPKMEPYGQGLKKLLIVGDAPNLQEDEEGRPYTGNNGQLVREVLSSLGVRLDRDALVTNSLICRPPRSAQPEAKQIRWCRPNLLNTIREFEPKVIVTLGRAALDAVIQEHWKGDIGRTVEKWVGWKIPLEKYWVCPTYHPSEVLRARNVLMDRLFADHLDSAIEKLDEPLPEKKDRSGEVEILFDPERVKRGLRDLDSAGGWVAVDYETNCLKPEYPGARLLSMSASNGRRTIAYPICDRTAQLTSRFLRSPNTRKIASNLKMEERWTRKTFGHGVRRWGWDTMLAAHCLDNRPGICSLKFQAFVKLGIATYNSNIEPYLESKDEGHFNRIAEIDIHHLLTYNGFDSLYEHELAMIQMEEMDYK